MGAVGPHLQLFMAGTVLSIYQIGTQQCCISAAKLVLGVSCYSVMTIPPSFAKLSPLHADCLHALSSCSHCRCAASECLVLLPVLSAELASMCFAT